MNKYHLILRNEETLKDKNICKFRLKWFYILLSLIVAIIMLLNFWMFNTIFSKWVNPLHYYNISSEKLTQMSNTIQELETHAKQHEQYIAMLHSVIGKKDVATVNPMDKAKLNKSETTNNTNTSTDENTEELFLDNNDASVRLNTQENSLGTKTKTYNTANNNNVKNTNDTNDTNDIDVAFFSPTNGTIVFHFNEALNPYKNGATLKVQKYSPICCVSDGTIVYSGFIENQNIYITIIQHKNSVLSIYRHTSKPLKSTGNALYAGDIITIVDSSLEEMKYNFSFELWIDCHHVNPEDYISF